MNTTITTKSEQGGNPDQQNHNPQLHRQNFRTQTQNFFHLIEQSRNNYK